MQQRNAVAPLVKLPPADDDDMPTVELPRMQPGQSIDWRSLALLVGLMAFFGLVAAWAWGAREGVAASLVLVTWAGGMVLFILLLIFVQSETLLQFVGLQLSAFIALRHIRSKRIIAQYAYDAETQRVQIQAEAQTQIAAISERLRLSARDEMIAQVDRHSLPQSHSNQLANYVPPETVPFRDELRDELLRYLVGLYDGGLQEDGRIKVAVPWSARGKMNTDKVVDLFSQAKAWAGVWVVKQAENKHWYVNVDKFSTPGQLVRAFDKAHTMGG